MTSEIAACIALAVIFISTVLFAVWITVLGSRTYERQKNVESESGIFPTKTPSDVSKNTKLAKKTLIQCAREGWRLGKGCGEARGPTTEAWLGLMATLGIFLGLYAAGVF